MTGQAPGGRPIVHPVKKYRRTEQRCCPRCLNLMIWDGKHWYCPKHGPPDRP